MSDTATEVQVDAFRRYTQEVFLRHRLGEPIKITPATEARTIGSGGTSKTFRIVTGQGDFFVKFAEAGKMSDRTKYHRELESYDFPVPCLLADGITSDGLYDYIVLEWLENRTLLSCIQADNPEIKEEFTEVLDVLFSLWEKSWMDSADTVRSGHLKKTVGLEKKLREYLGAGLDFPLIINGEEVDHELTISQMIAGILSMLDHPLPFVCKTHGESRTGNILVTKGNSIRFTDMRGGYPYWGDDLVFLGWHREFWLAQFRFPPNLQWVDGSHTCLEVEHCAYFPFFVGFAEEETLKRARAFAEAHGDKHWERNYYALVAACSLREIDSIQRRRKKNLLDFALPPGAEGFWIAEAVRYFQQAQACP